MDNTREKLIELLTEAEEHAVDFCVCQHCEDCTARKYGIDCRKYLQADHLIANGVTIATDNNVGRTVYALYSRFERKGLNGKTRKHNHQITTNGNLEYTRFNGSSIEIREKRCTKRDLNLLGRLVFKTKEEAERVISHG